MMQSKATSLRSFRQLVAILALTIACSMGGPNKVYGQADFSSELPRIPPTEPQQALQTFQVVDGYEVQSVVTEPMITSPVAIEWDAAGRMYVCEMRGYSEDRELGISRIVRLTDIDGDGTYDQRDVFVDGLLWPTAIYPYDGGLFVGDAPNLYYFKDRDGDGRAEEKRIVLTGFGTSNVQGLMNSFRWDLDNRLHIACSSAGGEVNRPDDTTKVNVRGRDIAVDPRTGDFQLTSGGAQHGMSFDNWGHKFVSSNSNHIQQVMYEDRYVRRNRWLRAPGPRVSIAADGPQAEVYRISPVEPWRIVRTRLRVSGLAGGPIEGGGRAAGYFTGATGLTIFRGDAWPPQDAPIAIVGDAGGNLVHRKRLKRNGLQFLARRIDPEREFVASSDIWFRPVQFACAPDGSLHIIDMCREVIEHPKSLPPDIKRHLDLTSGRDRGRIYRVVGKGFAPRPNPDLRGATVRSLVELLAHPNAWHRETASRLLFQHQDPSAVIPLRELLESESSPLAKLHALYALDGLGQLRWQELIACLSDPEPQLRRHAIRLSERVDRSDALVRRLVEARDDPSIDVRYQLAWTAGELPEAERKKILVTLALTDFQDPWMTLAIQSSLAESAIDVFAATVVDPRFDSPRGIEFLTRLVEQIRAQNRPQEIERALSLLAQLPDQSALLVVPLIGTLSTSQRIRSASDSSAASVAKSSAETLSRLIPVVAGIAANESEPMPRRTAATALLAYGSFQQVKPSLLRLLDNESYPIQRAAIATLAKFSDIEVAQELIDRWPDFSPGLQQLATEVLFERTDRVGVVLDAIEDGDLNVRDIDVNRLQIAARSKDPQIRSRAEAILSARATPRREDVLARYRDVQPSDGDFYRGRSVFRKHCAVCHRLEGVGHVVGPNLATIKSRGAETILTNVLDPNREVNPEYLNYVALTVDGRTVTGMIDSETANSITLRRAESASDTILRSDLDQLQNTGQSLMPEGLEDVIDRQQMADLLAYLMQVGLYSESSSTAASPPN